MRAWVVVLGMGCIGPVPGSSPPYDTGVGPGQRTLACYLGPDRRGQTCFEAVEGAFDDRDYDYPPPFGGSAQYRAPRRFLDLSDIDPGVAVAPNFVMNELATEARGRFAVVQRGAVANLQAVRDRVGILVVNSGYRSPGYNASIPGSASSSRHLYGDGFDLDPRQTDLDALADACDAEGAGYVEVYTTHVHCDWRDDSLDPAFYDRPRSAVWTAEPERSATIVAHGDGFAAPAVGFDEGEPRRVWTARDASGEVLAIDEGATFVPPPATARLEVSVGRVLTRVLDLTPP